MIDFIDAWYNRKLVENPSFIVMDRFNIAGYFHAASRLMHREEVNEQFFNVARLLVAYRKAIIEKDIDAIGNIRCQLKASTPLAQRMIDAIEGYLSEVKP